MCVCVCARVCACGVCRHNLLVWRMCRGNCQLIRNSVGMRDQVGFLCFNLLACTILASVWTTGLNLLASPWFATELHISPACGLCEETVRFVAIKSMKSEQESARNHLPFVDSRYESGVSDVSILKSVLSPPLAEMGRSGRPLLRLCDCCWILGGEGHRFWVHKFRHTSLSCWLVHSQQGT